MPTEVAETVTEANQELFILKKTDDGKWRIARYSFSTTIALNASNTETVMPLSDHRFIVVWGATWRWSTCWARGRHLF